MASMASLTCLIRPKMEEVEEVVGIDVVSSLFTCIRYGRFDVVKTQLNDVLTDLQSIYTGKIRMQALKTFQLSNLLLIPAQVVVKGMRK